MQASRRDQERVWYCESIHKLPPAIEQLLPGYRKLFIRAEAVFSSDERVRGLWLSGSLARGTADLASDLDLIVAVADDDYEAFAASWREWLRQITRTVLAGELPGSTGSFWSVTSDFERFDVIVEPVSKVPTSSALLRVVVFDHDGLTSLLPPENTQGPSPVVVAELVDHWFHFSAMLEVILWREDWLLADQHLRFIGDLLYKLYVQSNHPLPPTGMKRWSQKLTDQQRRVLEELPTSARTAEELLSGQRAIAERFLTAARPLAQRLGVEWPVALEEAATRHLREDLGIAEAYPA